MRNIAVVSVKEETRFGQRALHEIGTELSRFLTENNIFIGKPTGQEVAVFVTMMTREEVEASKKDPDSFSDFAKADMKKKIDEQED